VADGRDLVGADVRVGHFLRRRLTPRRVTPRRLVVRRHADLVGPEDLGPFLFGTRLNGRVGLLQPLPHLVGVLVTAAAARPLGGEAPAAQVQAHGPYAHAHATPLADQLGDGAARPQRGGDAEVFGLIGAQRRAADP